MTTSNECCENDPLRDQDSTATKVWRSDLAAMYVRELIKLKDSQDLRCPPARVGFSRAAART